MNDKLRIKKVFRISNYERKIRLFRLLYNRGLVGYGDGYSCKISFSIVPKLYSLIKKQDEWRFSIAGLSVHYVRSYGGIFV